MFKRTHSNYSGLCWLYRVLDRVQLVSKSCPWFVTNTCGNSCNIGGDLSFKKQFIKYVYLVYKVRLSGL